MLPFHNNESIALDYEADKLKAEAFFMWNDQLLNELTFVQSYSVATRSRSIAPLNLYR